MLLVSPGTFTKKLCILLILFSHVCAVANPSIDLAAAEQEKRRLVNLLRELQSKGKAIEDWFNSVCPNPKNWTSACQTAYEQTSDHSRNNNDAIARTRDQLEDAEDRIRDLNNRVDSIMGDSTIAEEANCVKLSLKRENGWHVYVFQNNCSAAKTVRLKVLHITGEINHYAKYNIGSGASGEIPTCMHQEDEKYNWSDDGSEPYNP